MPVGAELLSFENPVFYAYVLAASIMLLKLMLQPWMTVVRMLAVGAGYRSPEDAKKSPEAHQSERSREHSRLPRSRLVVRIVRPAAAARSSLDLDLCRLAGSTFRCLHNSTTTRHPRLLLDLEFRLRHRHDGLRFVEYPVRRRVPLFT
jgi:hypothetical protein